jgi:3D-(3,5/4)-trihydroxycyclohexane-1,2-dione acylhydrolase (decyclizing)
MGHELPAGLGLRMARPNGEVYVVIGDGTYLMGNTELVTAVQEQLKVTLILLDNHGYQCIRDLQIGKAGIDFGNEFRTRDDGRLTGDYVPVDYASNIAAFGVTVLRADDLDSVGEALDRVRELSGPAAIVCHVEPHRGVVGSDTWWDVGVAQTSEEAGTREAADRHVAAGTGQRYFN